MKLLALFLVVMAMIHGSTPSFNDSSYNPISNNNAGSGNTIGEKMSKKQIKFFNGSVISAQENLIAQIANNNQLRGLTNLLDSSIPAAGAPSISDNNSISIAPIVVINPLKNNASSNDENIKN
jgi:hypothetical protein